MYSQQEELFLQQVVESGPNGDWIRASSLLENIGIKKTSKECRDRQTNYLNPILDDSLLSEEEIDRLYSLCLKHGFKWKKIL